MKSSSLLLVGCFALIIGYVESLVANTGRVSSNQRRTISTAISPLFVSNTDQVQPTLTCATSRKDFMMITTSAATPLLLATAVTATAFPNTASARGRATLELAYDRYVPRIIAGGDYYAKDLRVMIEKSDWAGLKQATNEPPPKTKEDRAKPDGGIADRLAQAGQFSDARVITACDLFAGAFSDSSVSTKTKKMKAQVEILREVVAEMNAAAREALGEVPSGGGLFGLGGGKKALPSELAKQLRALYVKGGNAWNQYIFAANDGLAVNFNKLSYLK